MCAALCKSAWPPSGLRAPSGARRATSFSSLLSTAGSLVATFAGASSLSQDSSTDMIGPTRRQSQPAAPSCHLGRAGRPGRDLPSLASPRQCNAPAGSHRPVGASLGRDALLDGLNTGRGARCRSVRWAGDPKLFGNGNRLAATLPNGAFEPNRLLWSGHREAGRAAAARRSGGSSLANGGW